MIVLGLLALSGCADTTPAEPTDIADASGQAPRTSAESVAAKNARPTEREPDISRDASVVFSKPKYSFTLAQATQGIAIDYEVVVERDLPGILAMPQGSAGEGISVADVEGDEETTGKLIPFEALSGNDQHYGLYDVGLPPPRALPPVIIREGRYKHSFDWDGRNWNGPSDTPTPKGDPFPPGIYSLEVSCVGIAVKKSGQARFRVAKRVEVTLVE